MLAPKTHKPLNQRKCVNSPLRRAFFINIAMSYVTVTEVWNKDHTEEQRSWFHDRLQEMLQQGRFIPVQDHTGLLSNSLYYPTLEDCEYVVKRFRDVESAQEYVDFVSNLEPVSMTIEVIANDS